MQDMLLFADIAPPALVVRLILAVVEICKPYSFRSKFKSLPAQVLMAREESLFEPFGIGTDWRGAIVAFVVPGLQDTLKLVFCSLPEACALLLAHVKQHHHIAQIRLSQGEAAVYQHFPDHRRPSRRRVPVPIIDGYTSIPIPPELEERLFEATVKKQNQARARRGKAGVDDQICLKPSASWRSRIACRCQQIQFLAPRPTPSPPKKHCGNRQIPHPKPRSNPRPDETRCGDAGSRIIACNRIRTLRVALTEIETRLVESLTRRQY
jgi:hypothetical protein